METIVTKNGNQGTLSLSGRFDFNEHRSFKELYTPLLGDSSISMIDINLANLSYMDSSALGMLLVLREKAASANKKVGIRNPNATVKQILDIANFQKLFVIS